MTSNSLPSHSPNQAYWDVSALEGGEFLVDSCYFLAGEKPGTKLFMPDLAFLMRHSTTKEYFLFDLGTRKDLENLTPGMKEIIFPNPPCTVPQDVVESLAKGGLKPEEIKQICISHLHFDHTGDPTFFTNATFLLGGESKALISPGYPEDPKSQYDSRLYPLDRTRFLNVEEPGWVPVGPFPRALDYFKDGSLYIVDAPGHLQGHINVLVRTSSDGGWLYFGGDSAHCWSLITGHSEIAGETGKGCIHVNKEVAADTIRGIRELSEMPRVKVILAHDEPWYKENKGGDAFWPGKIPSP
ncbi:Metallo-hydrolase/oxidoreductase [Schizopora paradoxa]|uniref:Metallo-hydrolase/oxidoreductase n=1 Tax=Schizopora paradoxa TaxID=27342 RepID=A0A0H2RH27_9AGAM|nr:Metallo-hydrolase/oxidoreductase [Schizopora paradoxa]